MDKSTFFQATVVNGFESLTIINFLQISLSVPYVSLSMRATKKYQALRVTMCLALNPTDAANCVLYDNSVKVQIIRIRRASSDHDKHVTRMSRPVFGIAPDSRTEV